VLALRDTTENDRDLIRRWRNQSDVAEWMYTDHEIGAAEHAAWLTRHLASATDRSWIIEWDGTPVGSVNLAAIDAEQRRCEWGIYLAESRARGTGAADGAAFVSLDQAFGPLALDRVDCAAMAGNERAIGVYERMGFRREGLRRAYVRKGGQRLDVVELGLLASEWAALRAGHLDRLVVRGVLSETGSHV